MLTLQQSISAHKQVNRLLFPRSRGHLTFGVALIFFAGMLATMLLDRKRRVRQIRSLRRPGNKESRKSLLRAIVGTDRARLAEALGPPRGRRGTDVWYFPIDPRAKLALAVTFRRAIAVRAEIVPAPRRALQMSK